MARRRLLVAIIVGGLVGGALDLLFAVSFAAYNGAAPSKVFQAIASGLLGTSAQAGGSRVQALGIACHFALSVGWAAAFAVLASRLPRLRHNRLLAAVLFGLLVFLSMRLVVLPLSAYPRPVTFKPLSTALDLLSHMFLFAGPIVVMVSRAITGPRPNNSSKPTPLRGAA
ncbi:hypothetical protein [Cognatilysobacter lacus]|uniref:DUF1440 domain-containing protein n=1 Tax=Cognatilysobacter lacus TaxID=1643323 RepID=A0A5D8Z2N2_9GAMM|nr:hypothetical protein [Lysobacter lacus]TZF86964.1 hypothetical protein FW784_11755 [Lysobacter lacus]